MGNSKFYHENFCYKRNAYGRCSTNVTFTFASLEHIQGDNEKIPLFLRNIQEQEPNTAERENDVLGMSAALGVPTRLGSPSLGSVLPQLLLTRVSLQQFIFLRLLFIYLF